MYSKRHLISIGVLLFTGSVYLKQKYSNQLLAWGAGNSGQLGLGLETNKTLPTELQGFDNIIDIDARRSVSAAITQEGRILTWGKSSMGILGHSLQKNVNFLFPSQIQQNNQKYKQVSCGFHHMAAVTENGHIYVWGNAQQNILGQLIVQQKKELRSNFRKSPLYVKGVPPTKVNIPQKIKMVSCGSSHTLALNQMGEVYSWGTNIKGVLGRDGEEYKPKIIPGLKKIVKVGTGTDYSLALNQDGKLFAWGNNMFSQLGISTIRVSSQPKPVQIRCKVVDFSCGQTHSGVINDKGQAFTWGVGNQGQLGHNIKEDVSIPRRIEWNKKIKKISCGGSHTAIITQDNEVYMFGRGRQGQLGFVLKDQTSWVTRPLPTLLQYFVRRKIAKIALGGQHSLALVQK